MQMISKASCAMATLPCSRVGLLASISCLLKTHLILLNVLYFSVGLNFKVSFFMGNE
jgi:hypothetical protein